MLGEVTTPPQGWFALILTRTGRLAFLTRCSAFSNHIGGRLAALEGIGVVKVGN